MTLQKTILAATLAAVASLSVPEPVQAQNGDPVLRFLNSVFPNADFRSSGGSGSRGWDDDDDDGGRGGWNDDDDDGGRGGRDDDDDDGGNDDDD